MSVEVSKNLVFEYFAGKTSAIQNRLILDWLLLSENHEQYYEWLVEWEKLYPKCSPELDIHLEKYIQYMNQEVESYPVDVTGTEPINKLLVMRPISAWLAAASVILLVGVISLFYKDNIQFKSYTTTYNETKRINLSDGSSVMLNSNTNLRVPRFGFGKSSRRVRLIGEANFNVTHTVSNQTFIVEAEEGLEVVVLGTEFTVNSRKHGSKVVLNKGKVQLKYGKNSAKKELYLKPGELVTVDNSGKANLRKTDNTEMHKGWANHRYTFDGTTLHELVFLFEDNYGIKLIIKDQNLVDMALYGSFQADSAEALIEALSESSNLVYSKTDNVITLDSSN